MLRGDAQGEWRASGKARSRVEGGTWGARFVISLQVLVVVAGVVSGREKGLVDCCK